MGVQDKMKAFLDSFECAVLAPQETFVTQSEFLELFVVIASGKVELTVRADGEIAQVRRRHACYSSDRMQRVELESGHSLGDAQVMYNSKSFAGGTRLRA